MRTCKILYFFWKRLITKKIFCTQFYLFKKSKSYFNFTLWRNVYLCPNHKILLPKYEKLSIFRKICEKKLYNEVKNNFNFQDHSAFGYEHFFAISINMLEFAKFSTERDLYPRIHLKGFGIIHWILPTQIILRFN